MNIADLGVFADAVYGENRAAVATAAGRPVLKFSQAAGRMNGFQAAAFDAARGYTVVAFRGTSQAMDGIADFKLGAGMNSTYFSAGEAFVDGLAGGRIILCGHSLGGAIAQVVANRSGLPMVTFNAPGVGVLASGELLTASLGMTAIRLGGMALSLSTSRRPTGPGSVPRSRARHRSSIRPTPPWLSSGCAMAP